MLLSDLQCCPAVLLLVSALMLALHSVAAAGAVSRSAVAVEVGLQSAAQCLSIAPASALLVLDSAAAGIAASAAAHCALGDRQRVRCEAAGLEASQWHGGGAHSRPQMLWGRSAVVGTLSGVEAERLRHGVQTARSGAHSRAGEQRTRAIQARKQASGDWRAVHSAADRHTVEVECCGAELKWRPEKRVDGGVAG